MKTELNNTLEYLYNRGIILYPTDTVWGIGCDATNEEAVKKVFNIKQRNESKSLIVFVDSLEMLQQYVDEVPDTIFEVLEKFNKPTTVIYNNPNGLAKNVIAKDNTVAIRIVQDKFCNELIHKFGKPIVSTSANISNKPTPKSFKEIESSILEAVDYVVNLRRNKISNTPSAIVKINEEGGVEVIRE